MESDRVFLEVWHGARDAARRFGADAERARDFAQDAALAALQALARGKAIRSPRAFGRRVAQRMLRAEYRRPLRAVAFADGLGFGVEGKVS